MDKHMKFGSKLALFAMLAATAFQPAAQAADNHAGTGAKYVFYFIGDGMSAVQIYAATSYLTALDGRDPNNADDMAGSHRKLVMDSFPVRGMQRTYAQNHLITDSAAAGTALACGSKTNSGVIGMDATKKIRFKSVAELAKEQGRKVAILSSVSLDHATPASFYANSFSRDGYEEIAVQAAQSGFDFFGGGSWLKPAGAVYKELCPEVGAESITPILSRYGYTTIDTNEGIRALKSAPRNKVVCSVPVLAHGAAMPYDIDRPEGQVTLAEMTEVAIDCLMSGEDTGFFMMVEGGKVDWACHANDAIGMLGDVIDLDAAVAKAVEFYKQHPDETLIVVTADHETGGLTIGFAGRGYETSLEKLARQKMSFEGFTEKVADYKTRKHFPQPYDAAANNFDDEMKALVREGFGIDFDTLTPYRKNQLEDAYDRSMSGAALPDTDIPTGYDKGFGDKTEIAALDYLYYGNYDALTMEICHQMSRETGLGWTSYSHTAVPVPVMALGLGSEAFDGYYENAEVAAKIAEAMHFGTKLPVIDR
jgi:alkaline phosphatase